MQDRLESGVLFGSPVYSIRLPQFLEVMRAVSRDALSVGGGPKCPQQKEALCDHVMSPNYAADPRIAEFVQYVSQTAWNILSAQGYAMQYMVTVCAEMWTQEHHWASDMPAHVHAGGAQLCAFYFLDCPEHSPMVAFHDPRPGKAAAQLLPAQMDRVTEASDTILFKPEEGMLMLANAWLPHSFTRNPSTREAFRFTHINIGAIPAPIPQPDHEVEVL